VPPLLQQGVRRIVLTASGGPFRQTPIERLDDVTPEQAAAHPNWTMGRKISIDSATMMNKGLELIEACVLYSLPPDRIDIVVHPQSTVHSLVSYADGSVLAQLGSTDMRIPIAHALAWPERLESGAAELDLCAVGRLEFERPDEDRFPCLRLARRAAEAGGTVPAVLNAANEVAVDAFCGRTIRFTAIAGVIEWCLDRVPAHPCLSVDDALAADRLGRRLAARAVDRLAAGESLGRSSFG
jgi:1-deoxy-D-xylulose-5-phosphate reductoisomerase